MKFAQLLFCILISVACSSANEPMTMSAKSEFKPHYSSPPKDVAKWEEVDLSGSGLLDSHIDTEYLEACNVESKENVDYPRAYFSNSASSCSYSTE